MPGFNGCPFFNDGLVQTLNHTYDFVRVWQNAGFVFLPELDHALFVDDEHCPLAGPALFVVQVIGLAGLTLGVEVGQLGVGQTAQSRGPSTVGGNSVATDAQNLGIVILEPLVLLTERGGLRRSTSGEIEYMEGKDNRLLAFVFAQ